MNILFLILCIAVSGCVSIGKHREAVKKARADAFEKADASCGQAINALAVAQYRSATAHRECLDILNDLEK